MKLVFHENMIHHQQCVKCERCNTEGRNDMKGHIETRGGGASGGSASLAAPGLGRTESQGSVAVSAGRWQPLVGQLLLLM